MARFFCSWKTTGHDYKSATSRQEISDSCVYEWIGSKNQHRNKNTGCLCGRKTHVCQPRREFARHWNRKLFSARRVSNFLDHKGCCTLHKSQVRPLMEYCPLTGCSCSNTRFDLLNVIQRCAKRKIDNKTPLGPNCSSYITGEKYTLHSCFTVFKSWIQRI